MISLKDLAGQFSVRKLRDDLDYWIFIGIGDDIIKAPESRREYAHFVQKCKERGVEEDLIPIFTLEALESECLKPWFLRATFWRLLVLNVLKLFR